MPFAPNGLIALTTDFGTEDPFAGIVRGRILGRFPDARIIDLSHGIPAGRADIAGFWLACAWLDFPPGTVHLAVVDPGVGTSRRVMLALAAERLLLAPDNGLLPETLRAYSPVQWFAMDPQLPARLGIVSMSRTFHGRDLFAPLAAALASGDLRPGDFGAPATPCDPAPIPVARQDSDGIFGQVVLADHFGNLITNIGADSIAGLRQPVIRAGQREWELLPTYGGAPDGAPLALINAFGLLELALNGGDAAAVLGLGEGTAVCVRDGITT